VIKIWRLFPYAQESLAPLMSFYCAHLPIYMSVMKKKLAVAFQEHITATYSVVLYNISDKGLRHIKTFNFIISKVYLYVVKATV